MSTGKKTIQWIFTIILTLGLGGGVWGLVKYWDWLDVHHVAGVIIIGLLFWAMGILGMTLQVHEDLDDEAPAVKVAVEYGRYIMQYGIFLVVFLGILAGVVILVWKYLVPVIGLGFASFVFPLLFLLLIGLVIKVLTWLADQGTIGPPND